MQQPLSVPGDYDDEGEAYTPPPVPRFTPEQIAERSALEVFPGGAAALESDAWWETTDATPAAHAAPAASDGPDALEASTEDRRTTDRRSAEAGERRIAWPFVSEGQRERSDTTPPTAAPAHWEPEATEADDTEIEQSADDTFEDEEFDEGDEPELPFPISAVPTGALQQPAHAPSRGPQPTEAFEDDVEPSIMAFPRLAGREQRAAAGASQRAAIMAAAGAPLTAEELAADEAAAYSPRGRAVAPAPPAKPASQRRLTRKIALSLFVISLAFLVLSGGLIASGQRAEVERVAASLAPDVVERWLTDRVSSFGAVLPAADDSTPADVFTAPIAEQPLFGLIANTEGVGVAVRSTCATEARTPRMIAEGTAVTVIAQGVGDCAGWSVVRAGAAVSWVQSAYLGAGPTP
ncbi:MAG: hypothetical protein O3A10_13355 [Chloroflexi bacterium]|nr:hypothetical protein [Chloroflexota bacterium]MDA1147356.1 hypothetical protein [Chloroflexota bacterium]